jgi:hypothetical protein
MSKNWIPAFAGMTTTAGQQRVFMGDDSLLLVSCPRSVIGLPAGSVEGHTGMFVLVVGLLLLQAGGNTLFSI